jgi:WD40 repeat protein
MPLETELLLHAVQTGRALKAVAVSPDGATLVVGTVEAVISVYDFPSLEVRFQVGGSDAMVAVAFGPTCSRLAAVGSTRGDLRLIDVRAAAAHEALVREFKHSHIAIWAVALNTAHQLLAAGYGDCAVRLWSTATGEMRGEVRGFSLVP